MRFLAPTTHEQWRIHESGACLTPFVALTGFLTLSVPCSPPRLPTLFHAGNAHGVHPSELSPLEEPYRLSAAVAFLTFTTSLQRRRTRTCHANTGDARCSLPARSRCVDLTASLAPAEPTRRVMPPGAASGQANLLVGALGDGPSGARRTPDRAAGRSRRRHRGRCVPGGVKPSARRAEHEAPPPVGTARTPCGRQGGRHRCGRRRSSRTQQQLGPVGRTTSAAAAEQRPSRSSEAPGKLSSRRATGRGRPELAAAPKHSASHRRRTNLPASRPRRVDPRAAPAEADTGRGVRRRTLGQRRSGVTDPDRTEVRSGPRRARRWHDERQRQGSRPLRAEARQER
jgi:hypothetical protein